MMYESDAEIRLNENGVPDIEYYIAETKRRRNIAITELAAYTVDRIRTIIGFDRTVHASH